jgi:carbamoyl-phosphate synthase large subunit
VMQYLHDGWAPNVAMFHPPFGAFQVLANKKRLMEHLSVRMPVVVPRTRDTAEAIDELGYPVVIKPTAESGGKGVVIVRDSSQLAGGIARARAAYDDQFVIQQFIPGSTYIVSMVYDHAGQLVITAGMRSFVTFFTWGGGGWAAEMIDEPELLRLCADVVAAAGGWRGPINLEWRRHSETGAFYLLEGNCRLNGYSYLTTMNGVPLPRIVLALLTGRPLPKVSLPCERTRNFVYGLRETLVDRWLVDETPSRAFPGSDPLVVSTRVQESRPSAD